MPPRTRAPGKKRPTPTRRPWGPSRERACELTRKHSSAASPADERRRGGAVSPLALGAARGATEPAPHEARRPGRRRSTPYLLLLPGALWLGIFFVTPMVFLASQSLQTGSPDGGSPPTLPFPT